MPLEKREPNKCPICGAPYFVGCNHLEIKTNQKKENLKEKQEKEKKEEKGILAGVSEEEIENLIENLKPWEEESKEEEREKKMEEEKEPEVEIIEEAKEESVYIPSPNPFLQIDIIKGKGKTQYEVFALKKEGEPAKKILDSISPSLKSLFLEQALSKEIRFFQEKIKDPSRIAFPLKKIINDLEISYHSLLLEKAKEKRIDLEEIRQRGEEFLKEQIETVLNKEVLKGKKVVEFAKEKGLSLSEALKELENWKKEKFEEAKNKGILRRYLQRRIESQLKEEDQKDIKGKIVPIIKRKILEVSH